MPKLITNVKWTASGLPPGLSFDTNTGTFNGTPTQTGEYTVPVSVTTNYGSDMKDVSIEVKKLTHYYRQIMVYVGECLSEGDTISINLHDYMNIFGIPEKICFADENVSFINYKFTEEPNIIKQGTISNGERIYGHYTKGTLIEEENWYKETILNGIRYFKYSYKYNTNTGEITFKAEAKTRIRTDLFGIIYLWVETDFGESLWGIRIHFRTDITKPVVGYGEWVGIM